MAGEAEGVEIDVDTSEFEGGGDGGDGGGKGQAESPAEASERERRELAALLDGDQADEGDEGDRDAKPGKAEGKKPDKKAEPKKDDGDGKGDKEGEGEPEGKGSLAKNWREYRRARAGLDDRERQLAQREARLKEAEGDRAKASARLTALERLTAGDVEALDELGLDFEKLTAGYLGRQSGDKARSREKDPAVLALEKRLDEERQAREAEGAERQYREAISRFETAAAGHKILAKLSRDERIALGDRLASELHQAGKRVPPPEEIAGLLAQRLRADAERAKAMLDEEAEAEGDKGAKPAPKPISSRDRAERGGARRPAYDDDERDREREEIARELFGR